MSLFLTCNLTFCLHVYCLCMCNELYAQYALMSSSCVSLIGHGPVSYHILIFLSKLSNKSGAFHMKCPNYKYNVICIHYCTTAKCVVFQVCRCYFQYFSIPILFLSDQILYLKCICCVKINVLPPPYHPS